VYYADYHDSVILEKLGVRWTLYGWLHRLLW
jgi:hypothetical protein